MPHHMNDLGEILLAKGDLEEAGTILVEMVELAEKLYPEDHPDLARFSRNLARYYLLTDRQQEAERLLTRCYEIRMKKLGAEHPDTVALRQDLERLGHQLNGDLNPLADPSRREPGSNPPKQ